MPLKSKTAAIKLEVVLTDALYKSIERFRRYRSLITFVGIRLLVHGQVTIIFVVSVCLSVCLFVCLFVCAEFLSAVFDPISIKLGHMLYVWV